MITRRTSVLRAATLPVVLLVVASAHGLAQVQITSPREHFGFSIGDDYHLATYTQFDDYWHKLAAESPRMVLEDIGPTAEGRRQLMAIVTSPDNHQNLDRYRDISRRLALAEGLTDEEAQELAKQGRAVVWIDGGLHGSEVLGAHQLIEMSYQMVSRTDEETMRFLDNVIVLLTQANPDGMEIVSGWYMRETDPTKRSTDDLPRLYHKYVGHDNNRDSLPRVDAADHVQPSPDGTCGHGDVGTAVQRAIQLQLRPTSHHEH
jgi:hypothetical protein